jgi:hypothetical protein
MVKGKKNGLRLGLEEEANLDFVPISDLLKNTYY